VKNKTRRMTKKMGFAVKKKRDGTGPYQDSYQKSEFGKGKRAMRGEPCPIKKGKDWFSKETEEMKEWQKN